MPDHRRKQGRRHSLSLCLALFTIAVLAGNRGFISIGHWLKLHDQQLKELFEVKSLPSYSTVRRALDNLDYKDYSCRLAQFFNTDLMEEKDIETHNRFLETIFLPPKIKKPYKYQHMYCKPHRAINLVYAYAQKKKLDFCPQKIKNLNSKDTSIHRMIKFLACQGMIALDTILDKNTSVSEEDRSFYLKSLISSS